MIVFQKAGLSDLTIERGRSFPIDHPIEINQELYLTESNNAKVVDFGNDLELIEVKISGLSRDNYDGTTNGLKTWFQNSSINWAKNTFTMIDEGGTSHTVRFWQDKFSMPRNEGDTYSISFTLKKEA